MRILPPIEDSNSITHSGTVAGRVAISSTNAGLLAFFLECATCPSRFFSPI